MLGHEDKDITGDRPMIHVKLVGEVSSMVLSSVSRRSQQTNSSKPPRAYLKNQDDSRDDGEHDSRKKVYDRKKVEMELESEKRLEWIYDFLNTQKKSPGPLPVQDFWGSHHCLF